MGSLDDVIEETPVFNIEEMPVFNLANDVSIMGNLKEIAPNMVGNQFCSSGHIDCFGIPLVHNNKSSKAGSYRSRKQSTDGRKKGEGEEAKGDDNKEKQQQQSIPVNFTPWITTGLFPQFYCVDFRRKVDLRKVVLVASGIRRMHLEVFAEVRGI